MAEEMAEQKKGGGLIKKLLIAVIGLVLLIAAGLSAAIYMEQPMVMELLGMTPSQNEAPATEAEQAEGLGEIVSLPPFIVNLADPLGRRYLKLSLDVEVADRDASGELMAREAKVRDAVILLLSSKSYQDLATIESKILLKQEVAERLNQILGGPKVLRVYITDMVVQ